MATLVNLIKRFIAPALPQPPAEYEQRFFDKLNSILRIYFNQIDNALSLFLGDKGGQYISFPYGAFASYTSQSLSAANTATLVTMTNTDFANGVSLTSSRMVVAQAGIYNLQFSVQMQNLQNAPTDVFIWLKQNGTDIAGSNGVIGMSDRKNPGDPSHDIKGWNYFLSMNKNDYVEIWWSATDLLTTIHAYAASGSPTKPSTASVVATMTFVSAI